MKSAWKTRADVTSEPPRPLSTIAAAGMIHDLGNLIQVASSAVGIVLRNPRMPPEHAGPMLHRARTSLHHAGALVRQGLERIRDNARADDRSDVQTCLSDVAASSAIIDGTGLSLELQVEPGLPQVRCDAVGLHSAVLNLVFNARDAMAARGTIGVRARRAQGSHAGVEISVSDTGVGMSPATVARAFEPFFTTKSDGLGGVGLPMVEHFIREAGGDIAVESALGVGTIVTIRLPATAPDPPSLEHNRITLNQPDP